MPTRLRNFFTITVVITILSFFYVRQNIEILTLGYSISDKQKSFSYFLDQHKRLVYNLNKLESPTELSKRLCAENIELVDADINNIYYASAKYTNEMSYKTSSRVNILGDLLDTLTLKAEARAIE